MAGDQQNSKLNFMDCQGSGGRGGKLQGERLSVAAKALRGLSEVSVGEMSVSGMGKEGCRLPLGLMD